MSTKEKMTLSEKKKRQEKKRVRQTIIGAVALVAVIAIVIGTVVVVRNLGVALHGTTAVSTTGREMDKATMTYYFNEYLSDYVNERLYYIEAGYLNLNLKKDLKDQTYDGTNTWYSYFADKAKANIRRDMLLCELAAKEGFALTEAERTAIAEQAAATKPADHGTGLTEEDVRLCLEQQALAEKYLTEKSDDLYGTEADWDAFYADNKDTYITVDYLYAEIQPIIETAEEQTAYDALLEKALGSKDPQVFTDTVKKIFTDHTDMTEEAAASQVDNLLQSNQSKIADSDLSNWMFNTKTKLHDTYIDETTSSCKLYMMTRLQGQDTADTVNYYNILIPVVDEDAAKAKTTADDLLAQWKSGDATADSFAALAREHSKDNTSLKTDCLYENVFDGRMDDVVNDWLFAEERKEGDTAVLELAGNYQVVYYDSVGIQRWQIRVRNDLYEKRYEKMLSDAEKTYKLKISDSALNSIDAKILYE